MTSIPDGYVHLLTTTHKTLARELNKWKTAILGVPYPDGKFPIYVRKEEIKIWREELCDSTR